MAATAALTSTPAAAHPDNHPASCDASPVSFHVHRAHVLFDSAYVASKAKPDRSAIEAAQVHRRCIEIRKVRLRIGEYRIDVRRQWEIEHLRYVSTPYPGPNGTRWAIPYYIASCESGGGGMPDYHVGFAGAYGLLEATWRQWGGVTLANTSTAGAAKPIYQDIIAHRVWVDVGPSGWECA